MVFMHKLSRRLAISRGAAVLLGALLAAGCDQDAGFTQPESGFAEAGLSQAALWGRGKKSGDTTATSVPKPHLVSLSISPDTALLAPGSRQGFSARGLLKDGSTVNLRVKWSVSGGTIDSTGLYSAPTGRGRYHVFAETTGGAADTAAVEVESSSTGATVARVVLTPSSVSLPVGGTQAFTPSAEMSDGTTAPATVSYSATGGTITEAGLYTAGQSVGAFRVVAVEQGGKADTSLVSVTAPAPSAPSVTQIVLTPASSTLLPGAAQQFAASAKLSDGSTTAGAIPPGQTPAASASSRPTPRAGWPTPPRSLSWRPAPAAASSRQPPTASSTRWASTST
jgi:hypothetical protein